MNLVYAAADGHFNARSRSMNVIHG